jgi:hypothetical protein
VIYVRIRTSALGADFPADRFLRTPINTIRWMLRVIDDREKGQANLEAVPVARLTQILIQIAHGFSGSKRAAPKINVRDFLPYPEWRPASSQADGPSNPTKFVLASLGRKQMLPAHVLAALMTPVERRP